MSRILKMLAPLGAMALLSSIASAHHVPVGLSYVKGEEIVAEITLYKTTSSSGLPAYVLSIGEAEGTFGLHPGATFTVADGQGHLDTVVFDRSMFADISQATADEIVDAVEPQLTVAELREENGYFLLAGAAGGSTATLTLKDGVGSPLATLGIRSGIYVGAGQIALTLSVPADTQLDLSGQSYTVFASTTAGSTDIGGKQVPFAFDATTAKVLRASAAGVLPGFLGTLDGNSDSAASIDPAVLDAMFPAGLPSKIELAYVVYATNLTTVDYVSNVFTIHIVNG